MENGNKQPLQVPRAQLIYLNCKLNITDIQFTIIAYMTNYDNIFILFHFTNKNLKLNH